MKPYVILALTTCATSALAQEARQMDAHEHGTGELSIAIEGGKVAMELHAPGADIVGFEYEAESSDDLKAIEDAIAVLERPLDLFVLSEAAGCEVDEAHAGLEGDDHDDHEEHDEEHAEEKHDDHGDDHGDEHDDEHGDESGGHTEFHAEYHVTCASPDRLDGIEFSYFTKFENAQELEVQVISDTGAREFEVGRSEPSLDLSGN